MFYIMVYVVILISLYVFCHLLHTIEYIWEVAQNAKCTYGQCEFSSYQTGSDLAKSAVINYFEVSQWNVQI